MGQTQSNFDITAVMTLVKQANELDEKNWKFAVERLRRQATTYDLLPDHLTDWLVFFLTILMAVVIIYLYMAHREQKRQSDASNHQARIVQQRLTNEAFDQLQNRHSAA